MSKIGRRPITLPKGAKLEAKGSSVSIEGPKGKFQYTLPLGITLKQNQEQILIERSHDTKQLRSFHGLARALIANMLEGVSKGFSKELDVIGVGFKTQVKGANLVLQLGFSHPVQIAVPKDLKVSCPTANKIVVEGWDKQKVGQFVADIRRIMPPEPYKGKGIRYKDEQVRKKLGKAMAKTQ